MPIHLPRFIGVPLVLLLAVSSLVACGASRSGSGATAAEPTSSNAVTSNILLWVSNQSSTGDPVGIVVKVDGKTEIDEAFPHGAQNRPAKFSLARPAGVYDIEISGDDGTKLVDKVSVPDGAIRYGLIDYWNDTDDTRGPHFSFRALDAPPEFA